MVSGVFFLISKLLWIVVCPESMLLLLMAFGLWRLHQGRMGQAKRLLALVFGSLVTIAIIPVGYPLLKPLERQFPAHPALGRVAGIILLGGGTSPLIYYRTGVPKLTDAGDRFVEAVALARRFPDVPVLFTGGSANLFGSQMTEAVPARVILTELGVAPERQHFESASRTTAENAVLLRQAWRQQSPYPWLVVTSASHMPRAMGSFCKAGWRNLVAWPVDYRTGTFADGIGWDLTGHLREFDLGLKEWVGQIGYYVTGRSTALLPGAC